VIFELVDKASKGVKKIGKGLKGLATSTKVLKGVGIAAAIATAGIIKMNKVLRATAAAAGIQETAVRKLNIALARTGSVEKYSEALQAQASRLQELGQAGDEALIASQSLLAEMGVAPRRLEAATEAAVNLSAALGISLESATRNVARTTSGLAGELGELIPELREMQAAGTLAGQGIEFLLEKYSGAAAGQIDTFTAAVNRQKSAMGDLSEVLGAGQTDAGVVSAMDDFTQAVQKSGEALKDSALNEFFSATTESTINAKTALLEFVREAASAIGVLRSESEVIEEQAEEWLKLREATEKNRAEAKLVAEGEKIVAAAIKEVSQRLAEQADNWNALFGDTQEFNEAVKALGVTLDSELNEALERNADLLETADNRLRQGLITREDYNRITQAISDSERELNVELSNSDLALDNVTTGYQAATQAAHGFTSATQRATAASSRFQAVAGSAGRQIGTASDLGVTFRSGPDRFSQGRQGYISGNRFVFRGGSRLIQEP